jgi:proteasome beta subunit
MTLIIAIPAKDGVVFGSDSQVTMGPVRATTTKIYQFNTHSLWAASGEVGLIQRVGEALEVLPREQPLMALRDTLATAIKQTLEGMLRLDFRTQFVSQNPDMLAGLHPGDFLFVEHRDRPRILHVTSIGTCDWIDGRFAATGNGDMFAHALLQKYAGKTLGREHAKLLAYKVVEEAIQVGAYGLGPPVDIWEVSSTGTRQVPSDEIAALEDAARLLRGNEVAMLLGESPVGQDAVAASDEEGIPNQSANECIEPGAG